MSSTGETEHTPPAFANRTAWRVTAFLGLAAALNYGDRAAISSVFPPLQADLGIDNVSLGLVGAAFLWSYGLCSPLAGVLADRFSRNTLVVLSLLLWSIVTAFTGFANGLVMLVALRIALGLAESLFLPSAIALLGDHHGGATRGTAMSALSVGLSLGMIAGGTTAGYLAEHFGWRSGFWMLGGLGIILALASNRYLKSTAPKTHATTGKPAKPRAALGASLRYLAQVPTYHLLLFKTAVANIGTWMFFNWLPLYFHESFHLSLGAAGFAGTFILSFAAMAGTAAGGWLSDRLAARDPRYRLLLLSLSYFAATPFLLIFLGQPSFLMVNLALAAFSVLRGLGQANENPSLCEVVPPQFRSTAVGFMNLFATSAGGGGVMIAGLLKGSSGLSPIFASVSIAIFSAAVALLIGFLLFMRRDIECAQNHSAPNGAVHL